MTDYDAYDSLSEYDLDGPNNILDIDDTLYLVQGRVVDEITMFRPIKELLECERDQIQKALGGLE